MCLKAKRTKSINDINIYGKLRKNNKSGLYCFKSNKSVEFTDICNVHHKSGIT